MIINISVTIDPLKVPGNLAGRVRASLSEIKGSTITWVDPITNTPSVWTGPPALTTGTMDPAGLMKQDAVTNNWVVRAVITDLPAANDEFGPKRLYVQVVNTTSIVAEGIQPIEIFYDRWAYNQPTMTLDTNWFYYWKLGKVITSSQVDWMLDWTTGDYGYYYPGDPYIFLGDAAADVNSGPETYTKDDGFTTVTVAGVGLGPYCAVEVIAHEGFHKYSYEVWGPKIQLAEVNGENTVEDWDDPDDDGVPNIMEPTSPVPTLVPVLVTDPSDPDTFNLDSVFGPGVYDAYGDEEVRCRAIEIDVRKASAYVGDFTVRRELDWSSPGRNTVPPYPDPAPPFPAGTPAAATWWAPWP